jgi:hypothetical protein
MDPGAGGQRTVYAQHLRQLLHDKDDRDPRVAFCEDLKAQLSLLIKEGDQIIVGLDANNHLRQGLVNTMFSSLNMKDAIRDHYPSWTSAATCNSSADGKPIDGLYIKAGIELQAGGYQLFDEGPPTDHQALWIDVSKRQIFGYIPPKIFLNPPKRLTNKDPRTVKRYNKKAKQELLRLKIPHKLFTLEREMHYPPTTDKIKRYRLVRATRKTWVPHPGIDL